MLTTICCHNIWWQLTTLVPFRWMVGLAAARKRTEQYKGVGLCTQHCLKKKKKRMKKKKKKKVPRPGSLHKHLHACRRTFHTAHCKASCPVCKPSARSGQSLTSSFGEAMATAMKQFRQIVFMLCEPRITSLKASCSMHTYTKPTSPHQVQ